MNTTKTTKTTSALGIRVMYVFMILFMLFANVGTTPVSAASTYTISGNAGVAGATLSGGNSPATSDSSGNYTVTVNQWFWGSITPSKAGYTFSPSSRSYTLVNSNQTGQNYTATAVMYTISGSTGTAGANATITYTGGSTTANSSGSYSFTVAYGWSGTVTPTKTGYTFSPVNRTYSNVTSNQTSQNYTATIAASTITGNAGVGNVTITYTGGSTTANSSGVYSFTVSLGWSGTVTPSKTGFSFSPASRTYTNVTADQLSQNYTARPTTFTFVSMGDASGEATYFATTANQIATLNPDLAILNGDLEGNGFTTTEMNTMAADLKNASLYNKTFIVRGNGDDHQDNSAAGWESYFETSPNIPSRPAYAVNHAALNSSSDNLTYSFDYGNSIFIGLDVPGDVGGAGGSQLLTDAELTFLDQRLTYAENAGLTHAFIFFHGPEYPITSIHSNCVTRSELNCTPPALMTIINNHPIVSATFHGHEQVLGWVHMDGTRDSVLTRSYEEFFSSPAGGSTYNQYVYPDRVDYVYPDMTGSDFGFATIAVNGLSFTYSIYKVGTTTPVWSHTFSKTNTPPTISDITDKTTNEDTPTAAIPFTVGDAETNLDYLTITASSSNQALVPDSNIALGGSGANRTLTLTPAANQNGSATITVSVNDGNVTVNDTFVLTVNAVNDPPVADAQSVSMAWNTSLNIVLTGSDVENSPLTFSIVTNPANGSLSGSGANQTYTPTTGYSGTDSFTFKTNDGALDSAPATVSINVTAYTISGNAGAAGVTLSYTDGTPKTATADGSGAYSFQVPAGWSGTVTPSKAGYTFSPANMSYANVQAALTGQNFSANVVMVTISGNAGVAGATLSYVDGTTKTVTADSGGLYSFQIPYNWSGTVTPSLAGYGFRPGMRTYSSVTVDQGSQNYTTTTARVYYVDKTNAACTDTGQLGSWAVPFCTISRAANFVTAGQIVQVLHGTYAETVNLYGLHNGTAGNPVTYWADPSVTVTGTSSQTTAYSGFALSGNSYIVIDGFNITNTGGQGIYISTSDHITLTNNRVSYAGTTFANHPYIQGIWLKQTTYSTIDHNTTDHNTCIGIRLILSDHNAISNNISYENFSVVETDAAGIELDGSNYNTVINNVVYSNEDSGINIYYWDGTGVGSTNNLVIGNLSYENGDHGIDNYQSPTNTIIGNTVQGNGTAGINFEGNTGKGSYGSIVENNILSENGATPPSGSWGGNLRFDANSTTPAPTVDYNLFLRTDATVQIIWNNLNYTSLAAFQAAASGQEVHGLEAQWSGYANGYSNQTHFSSTHPLFVSPVAPVHRATGIPYDGLGIFGNYYPKTGAPEIDSANSNAPSEQAFDIDGNSRVDDPGTPNTGAGVRTYDDRGAYEYLPAGPSLPIVTTQAATGITQTTAVGNGNITATGLPNPTQHGVVWGFTANPTLLDNKTVDGPVSAPGAFTSVITNLNPGTLYHVRAYATNDVGTAYGDDMTFTTLLPPAVTTQVVTNVAATTATGNGNVTALGVPNPTQHGVVWSTSANPTTADSKTTDGAVSAVGAFTSSMTGLIPGTLYHVRAYVTNDAATMYGDDVTFTSLIVPTVTTQPVTGILTTTAIGNGNVTSLGIPNPTQHGFVWATTANPTTANSKTTDGAVSATGAYTSTITGLNPNTLYHVRAYATNDAGTAYGDDVTFTTLLAPTVTTQAVTNITQTTATGNGNITALGIPNPTQHGVVWSTALNPTIADSKTMDGPLSVTGSFTSSITGLNPGTLYHVRAYATNDGGTAYGNDVTFTTLIAPNVTTQAATNITQTSALANGTIVSLGVPNPTQYGVVWDINANPTVALSTKTQQGPATVTGAFTSNITGLNLGQTYHVRAYATNTVGTSYGDDVTFTTLASSQTTTTPVTNAGAGADVSGVGTGTWINTGNILSANSQYAQVTINSAQSHYLEGTQYGFAIPDNATINGITLTIGRYEGGTSGVTDTVVSLMKSGTVVGSNKASPTTWPSSLTTATYGSNADLWGTTWTPAEINGSGFGAALSVTSTANRIAYVDYMQIAVTYTVSKVSSNTSVSCGAGTPVVSYGSAISCVATVVRGSGSFTPTGTVSWTTDGTGSFAPTACTLSGANGTATCSVTYTPSAVGTGSHLIAASYSGDASFYNSSNSQTVTVNKVAASVTPNALSKTYGDADPTLTGTVTGFLPADNITATYSRTAGETVAGSPYTISATLSPAGVLVNYNITYNTANFNINKKTALVVVTTASKTYGDPDPTLGGTLTGFVPADGVTATYSRTTGENVAGSPYTISATLSPAGVLGNYDITNTPANFTINKKNASVTVNAASKIYGDADPIFTGTLTGFLAADNVTATYSRAAGETVAGGPYPITAVLSPSGVLANYNITNTPANFTITQKDASVVVTAASKIYGDTDPILVGVLTGFLPADNVTAAYSRAAGETVAGSPYAITATLSPAGVLTNYNITNTPANFTINKKGASVVVTAVSKIYGAADPTFTGVLTGFVPADGVTAAYSRTAGETVTGSPYTISAALSPAGVLDNYNITNTSANFTINKKDASVILNAASKTYGAADPALTGSLVGFVPADEVVATYTRTAGETVAGGPYTISATLSPAGVLANYNITTTPANFTINKKAASVTPAVASKTYGDVDPSLTGGLVGFVSGDDVVASYTRAAGETVAGGPYTISATLSPAGVLANYDITYNTANFSITRRDASVTPTASSKTYGAVDPALTGTLTGFISADNVSATYSRLAGETVAGGPYTISATLIPGGLAANYNITYNTAAFTINKKDASVTPTDASKPLSQPDPVLTGTLTGFLPADTVTATYSRAAGEAVGTYPISATLSPAGVLPNYNITSNTGTFTITAPLDEYTLTITKVGNGTVTKSPDQATYHYGDVVTLTATADPGWTFFNWSPNATGGTVTIHGNTTVTALFTQDEYTLTVSSAHGAVTQTPQKGTYHYGDVVTLSVPVEPGWTFTGWTPALTGNQVTIYGNTTVTANFTQDEYTLTVNSAHGAVTQTPQKDTYHYGDIVTLSVPVEPGWTFTSWTPALTGNQVTIHGNTTVTANFTQDEYNLTVVSEHGTVTKSPDQPTYHYGEVVTLTMVTEDGWTFTGWTPTLTDNQVTIQGNTTITANFTQNEYTLAVVSDHALVTKSPAQTTYHYGDVVTLNMGTVEPGWTFTGWTPALTDNKVTIQGNTTVTANFTQNEYTLTVNSAHGAVTQTPQKDTYHYGEVVTLSVPVEPGWTFTGWTPVLTDNQVTIQGNTTVTANFTQNEYTLSIGIVGSGTVTQSPDQPTYHYGDHVTLTATPALGWSFDSWSTNVEDGSVTIHGNTTVDALFTHDQYAITTDTVGSGTVSVSPAQGPYYYDAPITVTANPAPGWSFASWSGGVTGATNPATFPIHGSTTVTATFTQDEYTLTIHIDGHGTVAKELDQATYHYGDSVLLTATPDEGWGFSTWGGDLSGGVSPQSISMDGNKTVTATFGVLSLPTVTTQAVTDINTTTATGNGNITNLGAPAATQYGVVWDTAVNPDISLTTKTQQDVPAGTGAFTSSITGLTPGTLYHVRAYATNSQGTAYGNDVTFTALLEPTVTTQAVTDITTSTATGNGSVTALGVPNPTEHGVVWGTSLNPTTADSKTTDGAVSATGDFTSSITGLISGTQYHVRAYATNAVSTVYGADVTFTTLIAPVVTTQAVTAISTTSATGNGNITNLGVPDPTQHGVVWSTSLNPTTADSKTTDGAVSATGAFTGSITGLTPGTLYHVRAYATNAVGTSYGDDVSFTALLAPAVTTQAVANIADTTATGNGNITSLGVPNPTQYGVVWDTAINPDVALTTKTQQGVPAGTGAFTSSITGLAPYTQYHVRAYATNAAGTSYGDDVTFTTASVAPTVTTQAVIAITTTTATGNGTVTVLGVPNPTQHGVVWSTSLNPTTADSKTTDGPVSATGAFTSSITGLTPGTLYHVRAYATNAAGTAYGSDVTFTALAAPTVTTQAVANIADITATGNGNITSLGVPNPTQYGVVWDTTANPTIALTTKTQQGVPAGTGAFTSSITGLTQGTLYHVRAYVTNTVGTFYGDDVTFTTIYSVTTTTAATNARTGANVAGTGSVAWGSTGNITADDTSYATASLTNATSQYLEGTNYGFAIPANAYINGVVVTIGRSGSSTTNGVHDTVVSLIKGGAITGDNKQSATIWPTSITNATYGAASDLWGTTWTPADINASTFGVALSATTSSTSSRTASVDYMQITVTYTVPTQPTLATVTTQAATVIAATTATGNGTITSLGVPNPTQYGVVWGTALNPDVSLSTKTAQGIPAGTGAFTSSITGLVANTLYHVRAYATNAAGTAYGTDVTFTTLGVVPTVTASAATNVTTTTATGNGNITDLGIPNPTQYGVVWSTSANPTVALTTKTQLGVPAGTGAFTSAMTGLTPGTLYYWRAYATNAQGTAYNSADLTFTTVAVLPTVTTQAVTAIATTTATGNGTITSLGGPNPTYGVVWDTNINPTVALTTKTTQGPATVTGPYTSSITGLTSGTLYHVRAYATNTGGTVYGDDVTFTALLAPTVTTSAATNITPTSATGNGNITVLGVPNPTQYGVVWDTNTNPTIALTTKTQQGVPAGTGAFTSNITGLTANTLYHYRAYATNAVTTSYGADTTFTTIATSWLYTTGSGNWTAPAGVTSVTVEVWGGGGKGGSRTSNGGGGGGGGGAYSSSVVTVVPGNNYAYVVGAGATTTSAGGDSSFNTTTVVAKGGGSVADNTTTGASGGAASSGTGTTKYSGGNGFSTGSTGGGGGSSAGTGANGANATSSTGATAPSGGGNGGSGATSQGDGSAGSAPGGGGGGADRTSFSTRNGGSGAAGQVRITYNYTSVTGTSTSVNCGAGNPTVIYGSSISCVATVTASSGTTSPSGTVSWTTGGAGAFVTSPCTLSGTGGSATCTVTYTPNAVGTGAHLITATYGGSASFTGSNYGQLVTVNKLAASVTPNAASKTYGGTDPTLTGTLAGFLTGDGVTATYSRIAGETVAGSPYIISATLSPTGVLANYAITYNTASFTINKKTASVTPNAASKTYGDVDPASFTGTLTGFLAGDSVTATYSRTTGETVVGSPYIISATLSPAGVLGNYNITYNTANFTINKLAASVTPNAASKTYGDADPASFTGTLSGFLAADNVTATYSRTTGETVAGSPYTISATLSPAGVLGNYNITYNTANFTISKKAASVTPNAASKLLGQPDPTLTGALTGFLAGDNVTATYSRTAGETVEGSPYTISAALSPAGVLGNYNITYNTAAFTINPAPEYTLTINQTGSGTVTKAPDQATYHEGDVVTLTATPDAGWSFGSWSANATGGNVTIHGNTTVTVTFTQNEYTLAISKVGSGAVNPDKAAPYHLNDVVQLTAVADPGWTFTGWTGDCTGATNPCSVTMDGNKAITATFTQNELTLTVNKAGSGAVNPDKAAPYHLNDVVQLTAAADPGWTFAGWTGDCTGTANPCSVTMDGNKTVNATFTLILYNLNVTKVGNGAVNPDKVGPYLPNDVVQLTAAADPGWTFTGWTGDCTGATNPCSITMDGNKTVTATFTQNELTLTVDKAGSGAVNPDKAAPYHLNDVVQLTAVPDDGWTFAGWTGDCTGTTNPCSITMDGNKSVTATFTQNEFNLLVTEVGSGAVNPDKAAPYHLNDVVQLTAVPDDGWTFTGWTGDCTGATNPCSVTMDGNKSVTATFNLSEYSLTANKVGSGTINPDKAAPYHQNDVVQLTAAADPGWTFTGWTGDCTGATNPCSVTMDSNKAVTATFTQNEYTLTVNKAGSGAVNPDKAAPYHLNDVVQLTAVADPGWTFAGWTGDCTGATNPCSITIDANKTVNATFTQNEYTLTLTTTGSGAVNPDKAAPYHQNDLVQLTAVADPGWTFTGWTGDCTGATNPCSVTMDANKSVTATFTQNPPTTYTLTLNHVGNGAVTKAPDLATYNSGDPVQVTAVADPGWTFTGWSGDCTGTVSPCSVTMDGNKTVTATFTPNGVGAGTYDDVNPAWTYTGDWMALTFDGPYAGTDHFSMTIGNSAEIHFTGQQFRLIYTQLPERGTIDVYVDNTKVAAINTNETGSMQQTWTSDPLPSGQHTARFVHASGAGVDIDAIQILDTATILEAGKYDETSAGVNFSKNWYTYTGSGPYNDSLHSAFTGGESIMFSFSGQQFSLFYTQMPDRGMADVYVDGVKVATLNENGTGAWQQRWTSDPLPAGQHTVRFVPASGSLVDFDGVQVISTATFLSAGKHDETEAGVIYSSYWYTYAGPGPYSDILHFAFTPAEKVLFSFTGEQFSLTYTQMSDRGNVEVYVDGVKVATLDENGTGAWQQTWTSDALPAGQHTVRLVTVSGVIDLDAIQIYANASILGAGMYDDMDPAWHYSTYWYTYNGPGGPYGDSLHFAINAKDSAVVSFTGTQFALSYTQMGGRGLADIYVDGVKLTTLDESGTGGWQQAWTSGVLTAGTHTLRLVSAGGGVVDIDAITIMP